MAKNISNKKTNRANNRPNCLKVTKKSQKVNLQQVRIKDINGNIIKVRLSAREIRTLKNAA
ncbi:MAG: bL28 family ribosomal protein [Erysipelotrichaceae bacterium]|nr:bL28 family ribosomal protein [Erysipelotrichaceae bacterium]